MTAKKMPDYVAAGALFDEARVHRYNLWRVWDYSLGRVAFIGLNPSTADEVRQDPTVLKCICYARDWGYGGMNMLNLFSLRSTDPRALYDGVVINTFENDQAILDTAAAAALVVCAWGNHGAHQGRGNAVLRALKGEGVVTHCLGVNQTWYPVHPLYQPKTRFAVGLDVFGRP